MAEVSKQDSDIDIDNNGSDLSSRRMYDQHSIQVTPLHHDEDLNSNHNGINKERNITENDQTSADSNDDNAVQNNGALDPDMTKDNDNQDNSDMNNQSDDEESLNNIYGNRIGVIQSISLLINVGLMIYAHVGVSALILSNQQRVENQGSSASSSTTTNSSTNSNGVVCNEDDRSIWYDHGGLINRSYNNNYCSRGYTSPNYNNQFCLVTTECNVECFHLYFNYSVSCSECLGLAPYCGLQSGCAGSCGLDYLSDECVKCNAECTASLLQCTGFTLDVTSNSTMPPTHDASFHNETSDNSNNIDDLTNAERCENQLEGVDWNTLIDRKDYHVVYTLRFTQAVVAAWNGNARILAFVVVLFSGAWPYAKNVLLMCAWHMKLSNKRRNAILTWLKRLGKYSYVDIYAVIVIMVGVLIKANIGNVPVVVTAEPRGAIISFLVATIWECLHTEWMIYMHLEYYHMWCQTRMSASQSLTQNPSDRYDNANPDPTSENNGNGKEECYDEEDVKQSEKGIIRKDYQQDISTIDNDESPNKSLILQKLYFEDFEKDTARTSNLVCKNYACLQGYIMFMIVAVLVTLLVGSIIECISFTTYVGDNKEQGCTRSYSIYTLGTEMTKNIFMDGNSAPGSTWFMYLSYIFLVGLAPLFVVLVHSYVIGVQQQCRPPQHSRFLCQAADAVWSFASIEILLLAIVLVQHKFDELISQLAGKSAVFFGISSKLESGFYVLVVYSVLAGFVQYLFNSAVSEYYRIDTFHKINNKLSSMLRCFLRKEHP